MLNHQTIRFHHVVMRGFPVIAWSPKIREDRFTEIIVVKWVIGHRHIIYI
jgi:hypothetical protein